MQKTRQFGPADLETAAACIQRGELVAVPTETVYGLAGNGLNADAVAEIYKVKGRPETKPLSLMVSSWEDIAKYCRNVPKAAYVLAERFWPGPLTLIFESRPCVPEIVRAGGTTVGLRCPQHDMTLELIRRAGCPLAAPSANPSNAPSPKTAQQVLDYFDGCIAGVIDGGLCELGLESTILDLSQIPYRVLRQGALPRERIVRCLTEHMQVVGLTGGSGCGKTTALHCLSDHGALIVDCDTLYHNLLEENAELLAAIDDRFPGVVTDHGLERKALGGLVFQDAAALDDLNAITHRYVSAAIRTLLEDWAMQGGALAAIDAIALFESGLAELCTVTVGVTAPMESRMQRLTVRDGISEEYARMRIAAQQPDSFFETNCDYMLYNNGSLSKFTKVCDGLFTELLGGIDHV
ncbi:MAG: L-threonylcarbamoyladenylate synthase [Oscillospiraceae bacterium]|jgi:tRNA threonylcarbamoyl adenosine modification protein (Sua5/YciO/YrdC/YwlC family)/dephospho-CoA kinase